MAAAGWRPAGFVVLRTPLLPFEELHALSAGVSTGDQDPDGPLDQARVHHRARELALRPEVREALFIASPSLEERLAPGLAGGEDAELGREERPLLAYLSRMAARPTPFGLFAACATGRVSDRTSLHISSELRRHTRPDMDYLAALASVLNEDRDVRRALQWRLNSSLYRSAGRLRMVEVRLDGPTRSHHLVALEPDGALLAVLDRASDGASIEQLASALVNDDVTIDDAVGFIHELIDAQVLVSDLAPLVTGAEPLEELLAQLRATAPSAPAAAEAAALLEQARTVLHRLDTAGVGASIAVYRDLGRELTAAVPGSELAHLFQVDLFRSGAPPTLGPAVVEEAARAVELLVRVSLPRPDALAEFRDAFVERYETAEVPLLEALDEESGVGFRASGHPAAEEAPLLAGLELGGPPDDRLAWTRREEVLLRLVVDALRAGSIGIELTSDIIDELGAARPPRWATSADRFEPPRAAETDLPPTLSVMGRIAAASSADVDAGRFRLLIHGAIGSSGAQLLGRFCHGDAALEAEVRQLLGAEEAFRPDAVFAEVVHLPEGRIGNILCRPVLRDHEIVYLGRSGAPPEAQLSASDLTVTVVGDRVVLRSRQLGREVLPRLTSAHNTALRSIGVYRFLAALQHQGTRADVGWRPGGLGWDWGALANAPFLPRVTSGRLVLVRATWRARVRGSEDLHRLRSEAGLPRWVALADGDNEWVVDVENPVATRAVLDRVRQRDEVRLIEMFPPPDELCAVGAAGRYVHELILPLVRPPAAEGIDTASIVLPATRQHNVPIRRQFAPGSEWLYAKIYTGTGTTDSVLRRAVAPLVRAGVASGAADGWFFIRYSDPEHHLRLRLHGPPERLRGEIQPLLTEALAPLLEERQVWRVCYDTYQREVERYGGPAGIEACETLFFADSEAVLGIVERLEGDAGLEARWRLCVAGIDRLLDDFGFDVAERRDWARARARAYFAEFSGDPTLASQLGSRWRRHGRDLQGLVSWSGDGAHPLAPGLALLAVRSEASAATVADLRRKSAAGQLGVSLGGLVASLAHMHANRLLRSAARAQELVLYELTARLYAAQLARSAT